MPADERATLTPRQTAERLARHDSCCDSLDTYNRDWPHAACDCGYEERVSETEAALKETDRRAREDAAGIAEDYDPERPIRCYPSVTAQEIAAAIRASITTDEGETR